LNRLGTEPYARWCERGGIKFPLYSIAAKESKATALFFYGGNLLKLWINSHHSEKELEATSTGRVDTSYN